MAEENVTDVDSTSSLQPSTERVRNILTLEERVLAIQAYDCQPMYSVVAKMFNCSRDQIKKIIADREAILGFYTATKDLKQKLDPNENEVRKEKIAFLGACLYEYIQRSQFHKKVDLTEELIRKKAIEFRDVMGIEGFMPNKVWINHFKATYNFSLSNRQIMLTRTPFSSLDIKDIMVYCTKNKNQVENVPTVQPPIKNLYRTTTKLAVSKANDETFDEIIKKRNKKIELLELSLAEYIKRFRCHGKISPRDVNLLKITGELKDILKVDTFVPNQTWLKTFKSKYTAFVQEKSPLSCLDLKDIVNYCATSNKSPQSTKRRATSSPSLDLNAVVVTIPSPNETPAKKSKMSSTTAQSNLQPFDDISVKQEVIDVNDDDSEDIKPKISELDGALQQVEPADRIDNEMLDNIKTEESSTPSSNHRTKSNADVLKREEIISKALKLLKTLEEYGIIVQNRRYFGIVAELEKILKSESSIYRK